jgi:hypothetical protein
MPTRIIPALLITAAMCGSAVAGDTYTLHENLHVGQKTPFAMTYDYKVKSTSTTNGNQVVLDTQTGQSWKIVFTMLAVKDGSATRTQLDFDPDSFNTARNAGHAEVKTPCPFVGKPVIVWRNPDESFANDFQGNASDDDMSMLDGLATPDDDYYPDKPVAAGDVWDNSAKIARHTPVGPTDHLASSCRLDWVKNIDGKQMAQISNSVAIVFHEPGHVEEDVAYSVTLLVDVAAGMIVKFEEKGSSKYLTPASEATQVTGGTEFLYRGHVPGAAGAATQP